MDYGIVSQCYKDSFKSLTATDDIHEEIDENVLLKEEQLEFMSIQNLNMFPLIRINSVVYDQSINFRDFIKFACTNKLFNCKSYKNFKRIFLVLLVAMSMFFVAIVILFCRRVIKKKYEGEMNIKIDEAIQKYLTVDKV